MMRHQWRGRRTRDLALPPVWSKVGCYTIWSIADGVVTIQDRFSQSHVEINTRTTPGLAKAEDLTIVYNFSETRAALAEVHDSDNFVLLHPLFRPQIDAKVALESSLETPPAKRSRLMLKDVTSSPAGSLGDLTGRPTLDVGGVDPALSASRREELIDDASSALEGGEEMPDDTETQHEEGDTTADPSRVLNFSDASLEVPEPDDDQPS